MLPKHPTIKLTEKNFNLFAAQHYINPRCLDVEEFNEDIARFRLVRRLLKKYKDKSDLQERLILNQLTILSNMFEVSACVRMIFFRVPKTNWPSLKPFLLYLNLLDETGYSTIPVDLFVVKKLQSL